jgi:hypothetical protein
LWLLLGENLFFLVALGAAYQAFFAGDLPANSTNSTIIYFVGVLTALGVVMRMLPGQGLGLPGR